MGKEQSAKAVPIEELSPAALEVHIQWVAYPAPKQRIIDHAKKTGAIPAVIRVLERFDDRLYNTIEDVESEFRRVQQK